MFLPLEHTHVSLGLVDVIFVGKCRDSYRGRGSSNSYMWCSSKVQHQFAYFRWAWPWKNQKVSFLHLNFYATMMCLLMQSASIQTNETIYLQLVLMYLSRMDGNMSMLRSCRDRIRYSRHWHAHTHTLEDSIPLLRLFLVLYS